MTDAMSTNHWSELSFWLRLQIILHGRRYPNGDGTVTYLYRGQFYTRGIQ